MPTLNSTDATSAAVRPTANTRPLSRTSTWLVVDGGLRAPALIPDLLEFLRSRVDVVAEEVSDNEVDVSLVGSYNADAMNIELYLRVRAWEAGRRSTGVEV